MGTDICGFPRDGVSESFTGSHVHREGWRLKSVNHSHPPIATSTGSTAIIVFTLTFIADLHCTMLTQQRLRFRIFLRWTFHPHSVVAAAETRIVSNGHSELWNSRVDEQSGNGRQSSEQHHHLEAENRVRDPRGDRLSANDERPVVRSPHRDPVSAGSAEQSPEQRVPSHRTR